nr:photosystem II protein I [Solanum inodorum]UNZ92776.1 photosystem II protein I [Solanum inodorum]
MRWMIYSLFFFSQTLRLHSSDIFCFSLHLWIPI